jgi:hypothetical protein
VNEILRNNVFSKWACLFCGMLPVSAIALHVMGLIDLFTFYPVIILLYSLVIFLSLNKPKLRKRILIGWLSGIIAVSFYDISRLPFMAMGWDDFIPKIGGWLIGEEEEFTLGYLWRYIGNGGGLGITFFVLLSFLKERKNYILRGVLFGLFICLSLDLTLLISPQSETLMFEITPLTIIGGTVGHIVYGLTLGLLGNFFYKKERF